MKDTSIAKRYARALFQVALSKNMVEIVAAELSQLKSFSEKDKRFNHFLESPDILKEEKLTLIRTVFTPRLSQPLVPFLLLLIEKNRTEFLGDIAKKYQKLIEDYQGITKALITTAVQVSDEFKLRLKEKLEAKSGKKIEITHRINKGIIGGIIVQLDFKIIDRSVRHELESLRHDLMSIKVY